MAILIDGYNLLHVTGIFADTVGPGALERLHAALLDFLASALPAEELPRTTIVFDAKGRRATARRMRMHGAITVHYSARHEDADTLLAELIGEHNAPRSLIVVSSDHQVQRAARRRRAKAVDSDVWYGALLRSRRDRQQATRTPADEKPVWSENDALFWLEQFDAELLREMESLQQIIRPTPPEAKARSTPAPAPIRAEAKEAGCDDLALENPFPASYLEEIAKEIQRSEVRGQKERPDL